MKKLLYISLNDRSNELRGFFEQLDMLGYRVTQLPATYPNLKHFKNYDIVLIHHNRGLFDEISLKKFKGDAKIIWWVNDERFPPDPWRVMFKDVVDLFLVASYDSVEAMRSVGAKAEYLIMGYKAKQLPVKNRPIPLCFTGQNSNNNFPLSRFREATVKGLKSALGNDFKIYGKGWTNSELPSISSGIYSNSLIGLQIGHYNTDATYSNRILQIMGNGALCLCHRSKGIEKIFGSNAVYFDNTSDAIEMFNYYMNNKEALTAVAKRGFDFVTNNLTWKHKAIELDKIIYYYGY